MSFSQLEFDMDFNYIFLFSKQHTQLICICKWLLKHEFNIPYRYL